MRSVLHFHHLVTRKLRISLTTFNEGSVGQVQQVISLTLFRCVCVRARMAGVRNGQSALKISIELYK